MTKSTVVHALGEAELNLVAGGVRDNPWSDATNRRIAAQNGAEGTYGGSPLSVHDGGQLKPNHGPAESAQRAFPSPASRHPNDTKTHP
jgi:hypothetical protein